MWDRRTFLASASALVGASVVGGCLDGGSTTETPGRDGVTTGAGAGTAEALAFGGDREVDLWLSPSVPQRNFYVQYGPVRDYLGTNLEAEYPVPEGTSVDMNVGGDYGAVIEALGEGTADIAETGAFAAALGVAAGDAEVLLQRRGYGSWTYESIVAVPDDSDVERLSELAGKTVAFSNRLSTSGCLYPLSAMATTGGLDVGDLPAGDGSTAAFDARFAGGHVQSYALLEAGEADAAAMGGFVRDTGTGPTPTAFEATARTLHEDTGIPHAPLVVAAGLSDDAKDALRRSFLNAPDRIYYGADGRDGTDDDLWFDAVREAGVDAYQPVVDVVDQLDVGPEIFG
jgi:phosphonate transport system substrate-binding protein